MTAAKGVTPEEAHGHDALLLLNVDLVGRLAGAKLRVAAHGTVNLTASRVLCVSSVVIRRGLICIDGGE